ncbi:hypothetical protein OG203_25530 [Nocardia sp. NBC_01499]|uniref:hypothetical protein n=1 Tax=Nocardia sp. NBC_01499 TaxID=2903597 RepID=UPI00386A888B
MSTPLLDLISDTAVTRVRVLEGEGEPGSERRGDKKLIATSQCSYYCPDATVAAKCLEALRDSDERLRNRPEELMLWDWTATWWQADPDNENGGGTIHLGVSWYDPEFYADRKVAWFGAMHQRIYQQIGVPLDNIEVTHYLVDAA